MKGAFVWSRVGRGRTTHTGGARFRSRRQPLPPRRERSGGGRTSGETGARARARATGQGRGGGRGAEGDSGGTSHPRRIMTTDRAASGRAPPARLRARGPSRRAARATARARRGAAAPLPSRRRRRRVGAATARPPRPPRPSPRRGAPPSCRAATRRVLLLLEHRARSSRAARPLHLSASTSARLRATRRERGRDRGMKSRESGGGASRPSPIAPRAPAARARGGPRRGSPRSLLAPARARARARARRRRRPRARPRPRRVAGGVGVGVGARALDLGAAPLQQLVGESRDLGVVDRAAAARVVVGRAGGRAGGRGGDAPVEIQSRPIASRALRPSPRPTPRPRARARAPRPPRRSARPRYDRGLLRPDAGAEDAWCDPFSLTRVLWPILSCGAPELAVGAAMPFYSRPVLVLCCASIGSSRAARRAPPRSLAARVGRERDGGFAAALPAPPLRCARRAASCGARSSSATARRCSRARRRSASRCART